MTGNDGGEVTEPSVTRPWIPPEPSGVLDPHPNPSTTSTTSTQRMNLVTRTPKAFRRRRTPCAPRVDV